MKHPLNGIIGLIIGFSLAGNIYAYSLHTGKVVSVKTACAQPVEFIGQIQGGGK